MKLAIENAACGYSGTAIVENVSFEIESGAILCLLGPNGVGKTTFFKSVLGFLPLIDGTIEIDGESIRSWSYKRIAQVVGYVPQAHVPPFPFSVLDVVVMGRVAHLGLTASPSRGDVAIAQDIMEQLGIAHLRDRVYTEISGGERQMVLIARALTQNPKILIMDEPTSNLDFGNQIRVLTEIKKLAQRGLAIVMTSHFPDHAFLCSSAVGLFRRGAAFMVGSVEEMITEENLESAYGVNVRILSFRDEKAGQIKSCVPTLTQ